MGRKVHPIGFRLGIIKDWQSRWYADRDYTTMLHEDVAIRKMVAQRLSGASLSRVEIQRSANQFDVTLYTAKPGIVIGKGGAAVDLLRKDLETLTGKKAKINIEEIKQPELDAFLIAESIAEQLNRRVSYRRALKQSIMRAMRAGAKGVRIRISGRLGGAEMARAVWEMEGRVPLHTLRADIDYGQVHAHTTFGRIGVKVWVYRGDVIERKGVDALLQMDRPAATAQPRPERDRRDRRGGPSGGPPAGGAGGAGRPGGQRDAAGDRGGPRTPRVDGAQARPGMRAGGRAAPETAPRRQADETMTSDAAQVAIPTPNPTDTSPLAATDATNVEENGGAE